MTVRKAIALATLILGLGAATSCTTEADQIEWWLSAIRSGDSVQPLARSAELDEIAQSHARSLASNGVVDHDTPILRTEIIGTGFTTANVVRAWSDSPYHAAEMSNPAYDEVGIGTVRKGSTVYAVVVFR